VKRTKEKQTKSKREGHLFSSSPNKVKPEDSEKPGECHDLSQGRGENAPLPDLAEMRERFIALFEQSYHHALPGEAMPAVTEEDRQRLESLLERRGEAFLHNYLTAFFACTFGYVRRRGWSLGSYIDCIFTLQAQNRSKS
jgi:hypothetical protein